MHGAPSLERILTRRIRILYGRSRAAGIGPTQSTATSSAESRDFGHV